MLFSNSNFGNVHNPHGNVGVNVSGLSKQSVSPLPAKNQGLNAPMIDRVYKAKPGCSACGKKVA